MAYLLRLIALLCVLCALLAPSAASAQAQATKAQAKASCEASRAFAQGPVAEYVAAGIDSTVKACRDVPDATISGAGVWKCEYTFNGGTYGCDNWTPNSRTDHPYNLPDIQCDALNDNPETAPGPRLCVAENCTSRCTGGCALDIVGDPIATKPGRVQGQPVVYYQFNQQYTGETCTAGETSDTDDDFNEQPDGKECVPELGICVTPDGDNEYCTFNPDGTPSQCVPATDYDNDGVDDDDDTAPDDPDNGDDDGEGDESDNSAAGGAKCMNEGGTPPVCKGDGIQCNQLLQAYMGRCALERTNAAKVENYLCSIDAPLVCTNMSITDCRALAMKKKIACNSDKLEEAIAGEVGQGEEGPEVNPASVWQDPDGTGGTGSGSDLMDSLDMGGWLSNRTCPVLPAITVMGQTMTFDSVRGDMCDFFAVGGMLTLLLAAFACVRILGEI